MRQNTGYKDRWGDIIHTGDRLTMSYGIPPIYDEVEVVFKDGIYKVLTPKHDPKEISLVEFLEVFMGESEIVEKGVSYETYT